MATNYTSTSVAKEMIKASQLIAVALYSGISFSPSAYGDVVGIPGSLELNDIPVSQLSRISEVIDYYQFNSLDFAEIIEWDPWEFWLLLNFREESERKSAMDDSRTFKFSIRGTGYEDCIIRADSLMGGRSYIYDPNWNCDRLIFRSDSERRLLGSWMEQWFRNKPMTESESLHFFLAIPFPHCLVAREHDEPDLDAREQTANFRFIAPILGDFLLDQDMNDFVFFVAFEFSDSFTRQRCLRGIASVFRELPTETKADFQQRLLTRINELNRSANATNGGDDPELELLRKILEFVSE